MELALKGKRVLITAGAGGIGRVMTQTFVDAGAKVHICDVVPVAIEDTVRTLKVTATSCDVSDLKQVDALFADVRRHLGGLDVLVNNAGIAGPTGKVEDIAVADWERCIAVDLNGMFYCTRLGVPMLKAAGGGSIINLLNIGAKQPGASSVPTSVSRAAGLALTKALSKEYAADNIRVNAVLIGMIKSGQHVRTWERGGASQPIEEFYTGMAQQRAIPLGRVGEADEAGDLIAFLASARAAYISGVAINLDGGLSSVV